MIWRLIKVMYFVITVPIVGLIIVFALDSFKIGGVPQANVLWGFIFFTVLVYVLITDLISRVANYVRIGKFQGIFPDYKSFGIFLALLGIIGVMYFNDKAKFDEKKQEYRKQREINRLEEQEFKDNFFKITNLIKFRTEKEQEITKILMNEDRDAAKRIFSYRENGDSDRDIVNFAIVQYFINHTKGDKQYEEQREKLKQISEEGKLEDGTIDFRTVEEMRNYIDTFYNY